MLEFFFFFSSLNRNRQKYKHSRSLHIDRSLSQDTLIRHTFIGATQFIRQNNIALKT
jgi:hypothetical protein